MSHRTLTPRTTHAVASVGGTTLAETRSWTEVEGNVYFPPSSLARGGEVRFEKTDLHTKCPWKGEASYYSVQVGGDELTNAAWFYEEPLEKARDIKDYVAFDKTKVDILVD